MASASARAKAALEATFVADAASMGTHWVYDSAKLDETLKGREDAPEFHEPPSCPFYNEGDFPGHYASGQPSPYGEEGLALVGYLEETKGDFEGGEQFAQWLSKWATAFSGRKNHNTKLFEENVDKLREEGGAEATLFPACGADDAQANVFWKVPQLAARYRGTELVEKVETAVRAHQNRDDAVAYATAFARMLEAAIEGASLEDAIRAGATAGNELASKGVERAFGARAGDADTAGSVEALRAFLKTYSEEVSTDETPETFRPFIGLTCGFPQSFVVGLKLALDADTVQRASDGNLDVIELAVRLNIRAAGDTCGRVPVLVGLLAAVAGRGAPKAWCERAQALAPVSALAEQLVEKRA